MKQKIWQFLEGHPERWVQGCDAQTKDGRSCEWSSPLATCFCGYSLLLKFYPNNHPNDRRAELNRIIGREPEAFISTWNDSPTTKFKDVVEVFKKADL